MNNVVPPFPSFEPFPLSEATVQKNRKEVRTAVFYYDDHAFNSEDVFVGWLDEPAELRRALGNILFSAVEGTDQDFSPKISFREMTQEEVDELPSV